MGIRKLNTKLLLFLLPCFIVSFVLLSALSYYFSYKSLSGSVEQTALSIGTDYSQRILSYIREAIIQSTDFAAKPGFDDTGNVPGVVQVLAENKENSNYLESAVFIYPDGSAVRSDGTTVELGDRDYFKTVMATGEPAVSELLLSKTTGKLAFNVAVPVIRGQEVKGVMTGSFALDKLTGLINDLSFLDSGYGLLAEANGDIIIHPKIPELAGQLNLLEKTVNPELGTEEKELDDRLINLFRSAVETGSQTRGSYHFVDGVDRISVITPFDLPGGNRWVMLVTAPVQEVNKELSELARNIMITAFICLLASAGIIVFLSRLITRPIVAIRDDCKQLAAGDFREKELRIRSKDEIGQLAEGFQEMRSTLRHLITQVYSQSEQVAASSQELTASSQQTSLAVNQVAESFSSIAQGTDRQAAAGSRLNQVAEELFQHAGGIAAASEKAAESAQVASQSALEGSGAVEKTLAEIQAVGEGSDRVNDAMDELDRNFQEISNMIGIIASISSQTNLLALNASIEAARAGEHGRGFAVVASEVRKLAEESNMAASQINELVARNQESLHQALAVTESGRKTIISAVRLADATGHSFAAIKESILNLSAQTESISQAIGKIARSAQTMAEAARESDTASRMAALETESVSAATQEMSATMEEIAASSQSLAALAGDLQAELAKFRIG